MFGLLLITLATLLDESASSFGKKEVEKKEEGVFNMGFLNMFMVFVFLIISLFFGQKFIISVQSFPTLFLRIFLEIVQITVTLFAVIQADRSTFSFLRTVTIPLLLIVDVVLMGYQPSFLQMTGMTIITLTILFASYENILNKRGMWLCLFTGVNAVATISLYKYNISNYNSVVAEQGTVLVVLLLYLAVFAYIKNEANLLKTLFRPKFFLQSTAMGVSGMMETFAYVYAPASVIATAKRATSMLWSSIAGWKYFGEKNLLRKLAVCAFLVLGVFLLI